MKSQRIFISGVAGFLGSHIADLMLSLGHKVVGCDNLMGGEFSNVPSAVEFHHVDLKDREKLDSLVKNIDIVIHTAATAYDGLSVFSPSFVTENVYSNSISLLSASLNNRVRRFIFLSSMARYGNLEVPFFESQIPQPRTPYGIAKLSVEKVIQSLCPLHGCEYVICVPHNIIGPRQKFDDPYRNVAAIMINRMLQGRQPLIYGTGEQKRCFSPVQDTLQVFEQLVFSPKANKEIVNIGPDEEFVSINELAKIIAEILDFPLKPQYIEERPKEEKLANCSADKARKLFNYKSKVSLKSSLEEMVNWIREKGPRPFSYEIPIEIKNELVPKSWRESIF